MSSLIDIHTHLLPAVDDGADSMSEACEMLKIANSSGTKSIVMTPHHLAEAGRCVGYPKQLLAEKFKQFKEFAAKEFPKISLYLGAENHVSKRTGYRFSKDELIPINGTRYLLCEFDFVELTEDAYNTARRLTDMGFVPIIAHPERYEFAKHHPLSLNMFIQAGVLLQINASSITSRADRVAHDVAMFLLENRMASFVASDSHSVDYRPPDLSEAYSIVSSTFSVSYANELFINNPNAVINGENITSMNGDAS